MREEKRGDRLRIADIVRAIDKVQAWAAKPPTENADLFLAAVMREMGRIGEAVAHLSDGFTQSHPVISWHEIAGLRNRLVHEYWETKWAVIEGIINDDLPLLREVLAGALGDAQEKDDIEALYAAALKGQFEGRGTRTGPLLANGELCDEWMPLARTRCVLPLRHKGHHRSRL